MRGNSRYAAHTQRLVDVLLDTPGHTAGGLRRAALARAARLGGHPDSGATDVAAPAPVEAYVEEVARHAYTVTDGDIAALRAAGYAEDAIFEITLSAAVGAGLGRLERGLAALRGQR